MSIHLRIFEHLLPRSRTWGLLFGKTLREFFEGLANGVPTDLVAKADARFTDMLPPDTAQLPEFENQFGLLPSAGLSEAERRLRLAAAWAESGGQGLRYLEQVLHDQGFPNVYLHQFWEPNNAAYGPTSTVATQDDVGNATILTLPPSPGNATAGVGITSPLKFSVLVRFALNIPLGSRIVQAELRVTSNGVATGSPFRVHTGRLVRDGVWDHPLRGFQAPGYTRIVDMPSPTPTGSGVINPGVLEGDRFIPGAVWDIDPGAISVNDVFSIGGASFDPTAICDLGAEIQAHIDDMVYSPSTAPYIGFVFDVGGDAVNGDTFNMYLRDGVGESATLTVIWEPEAVQPLTVKNPNSTLSDTGPIDSTCCDEPLMECGEVSALCGETIGNRGFLLVNKVATSVTIHLGCGDPLMECGEVLALCGEPFSITFGQLQYDIPIDQEQWRYILYVGAEVWPEVVGVETAREAEFEELLLRICPGQQWLGMLVDYV